MDTGLAQCPPPPQVLKCVVCGKPGGPFCCPNHRAQVADRVARLQREKPIRRLNGAATAGDTYARTARAKQFEGPSIGHWPPTIIGVLI